MHHYRKNSFDSGVFTLVAQEKEVKINYNFRKKYIVDRVEKFRRKEWFNSDIKCHC